MRRFCFVLLALVLGLAAQPLVAATYYVGTCKIGSFGSISAAVASPTVLPGSIIDVCPGTYHEQIVINKALTIQGIFGGNSSQAVIAMPSGALTTTPSINPNFGGTLAAQIEVTAGPVNITNITVDGTATTCPSVGYVGIFYSSGSSGIVNEVETRNQTCNGGGVPESRPKMGLLPALCRSRLRTATSTTTLSSELSLAAIKRRQRLLPPSRATTYRGATEALSRSATLAAASLATLWLAVIMACTPALTTPRCQEIS